MCVCVCVCYVMFSQSCFALCFIFYFVCFYYITTVIYCVTSPVHSVSYFFFLKWTKIFSTLLYHECHFLRHNHHHHHKCYSDASTLYTHVPISQQHYLNRLVLVHVTIWPLTEPYILLIIIFMFTFMLSLGCEWESVSPFFFLWHFCLYFSWMC